MEPSTAIAIGAGAGLPSFILGIYYACKRNKKWAVINLLTAIAASSFAAFLDYLTLAN
jgi:hypothetical protein